MRNNGTKCWEKTQMKPTCSTESTVPEDSLLTMNGTSYRLKQDYNREILGLTTNDDEFQRTHNYNNRLKSTEIYTDKTGWIKSYNPKLDRNRNIATEVCLHVQEIPKYPEQRNFVYLGIDSRGPCNETSYCPKQNKRNVYMCRYREIPDPTADKTFQCPDNVNFINPEIICPRKAVSRKQLYSEINTNRNIERKVGSVAKQRHYISPAQVPCHVIPCHCEQDDNSKLCLYKDIPRPIGNETFQCPGNYNGRFTDTEIWPRKAGWVKPYDPELNTNINIAPELCLSAHEMHNYPEQTNYVHPGIDKASQGLFYEIPEDNPEENHNLYREITCPNAIDMYPYPDNYNESFAGPKICPGKTIRTEPNYLELNTKTKVSPPTKKRRYIDPGVHIGLQGPSYEIPCYPEQNNNLRTFKERPGQTANAAFQNPYQLNDTEICPGKSFRSVPYYPEMNTNTNSTTKVTTEVSQRHYISLDIDVGPQGASYEIPDDAEQNRAALNETFQDADNYRNQFTETEKDRAKAIRIESYNSELNIKAKSAPQAKQRKKLSPGMEIQQWPYDSKMKNRYIGAKVGPVAITRKIISPGIITEQPKNINSNKEEPGLTANATLPCSDSFTNTEIGSEKTGSMDYCNPEHKTISTTSITLNVTRGRFWKVWSAFEKKHCDRVKNKKTNTYPDKCCYVRLRSPTSESSDDFQANTDTDTALEKATSTPKETPDYPLKNTNSDNNISIGKAKSDINIIPDYPKGKTKTEKSLRKAVSSPKATSDYSHRDTDTNTSLGQAVSDTNVTADYPQGNTKTEKSLQKTKWSPKATSDYPHGETDTNTTLGQAVSDSNVTADYTQGNTKTEESLQKAKWSPKATSDYPHRDTDTNTTLGQAVSDTNVTADYPQGNTKTEESLQKAKSSLKQTSDYPQRDTDTSLGQAVSRTNVTADYLPEKTKTEEFLGMAKSTPKATSDYPQRDTDVDTSHGQAVSNKNVIADYPQGNNKTEKSLGKGKLDPKATSDYPQRNIETDISLGKAGSDTNTETKVGPIAKPRKNISPGTGISPKGLSNTISDHPEQNNNLNTNKKQPGPTANATSSTSDSSTSTEISSEKSDTIEYYNPKRETDSKTSVTLDTDTDALLGKAKSNMNETPDDPQGNISTNTGTNKTRKNISTGISQYVDPKGTSSKLPHHSEQNNNLNTNKKEQEPTENAVAFSVGSSSSDSYASTKISSEKSESIDSYRPKQTDSKNSLTDNIDIDALFKKAKSDINETPDYPQRNTKTKKSFGKAKSSLKETPNYLQRITNSNISLGKAKSDTNETPDDPKKRSGKEMCCTRRRSSTIETSHYPQGNTNTITGTKKGPKIKPRKNISPRPYMDPFNKIPNHSEQNNNTNTTKKEPGPIAKATLPSSDRFTGREISYEKSASIKSYNSKRKTDSKTSVSTLKEKLRKAWSALENKLPCLKKLKENSDIIVTLDYPQRNTYTDPSLGKAWSNTNVIADYPQGNTKTERSLAKAKFSPKAISDYPHRNTDNYTPLRQSWSDTNVTADYPQGNTNTEISLGKSRPKSTADYLHRNTDTDTSLGKAWSDRNEILDHPQINTQRDISFQKTESDTNVTPNCSEKRSNLTTDEGDCLCKLGKNVTKRVFCPAW